MAAKGKGKAAEAEPTDDDLELETLEDDSTEDTGSAKSKADEVTFGVKDLCDHVEKETGKKYTTREMRTLIRKMAREDKPRVNREVIPGNRSRYDWPKGAKDPEVKAIVAAVKGGEIEQGKKEALDKLKKDKAAKKGDKEKGKGKGKK
jgi:hypothetical protein